MTNIKRKIKKVLWRHLLSGVRDGLATQRIQSLVSEGPYIPWSESALSATAISTVLNDIVVNRRSTIVECGGGVSTLFIGSLLKDQGHKEGHLVTIEHDAEWIEVLRQMIRDHKLGEWVTPIHAPLCETSLSWNEEHWYDTSILESEFRDRQVDLLLVDGPPAHHPEVTHSRYPAGPYFKGMFRERCCVIIDDINRDSEREIMEAWKNELHLSFQERLLNGNIAIGTRGQAFTV